MADGLTLPTFLVIGAMKAGTTSLHRYLDSHPAVFMSTPKELDFFVHDEKWALGPEWYSLFFLDGSAMEARGETSPNYSKAHNRPGVPGRVASLLPDVRLVYLVREPMGRLRSMYRHMVLDGVEHRPFTQAVREDRDYIETGLYMRQLRPFLDEFEKDQVLVTTTERLGSDHDLTLAEVFEHIGVEPMTNPQGARHNVTGHHRAPTELARFLERWKPYRKLMNRSWRFREAHRRWLVRRPTIPPAELAHEVEMRVREEYEADRRDLEDFLGRSLDEWDEQPTANG